MANTKATIRYKGEKLPVTIVDNTFIVKLNANERVSHTPKTGNSGAGIFKWYYVKGSHCKLLDLKLVHNPTLKEIVTYVKNCKEGQHWTNKTK
jgi:hypothetical protein